MSLEFTISWIGPDDWLDNPMDCEGLSISILLVFEVPGWACMLRLSKSRGSFALLISSMNSDPHGHL